MRQRCRYRSHTSGGWLEMGGGGDRGRCPSPPAVPPLSSHRRGWASAALRAGALGLAVVVGAAPSRMRVAAQAASPATFPLVGRGDYWHSFGHPFESSTEEPLMHWEVKGGTILTSHLDTGRDVVRLTPALQGRAGILYNTVHADSNDFNGYVDFEIDQDGTRVPGSRRRVCVLAPPRRPRRGAIDGHIEQVYGPRRGGRHVCQQPFQSHPLRVCLCQ